MSGNQKYAPFRPALTPEQRERVRKAKDPMEEYGGIAIEEAGRQLALLENTAAGQNALPDDPEICHRFPNVDPRGQYSPIDMRLKQRTQAIDSALNLRDGSAREQVRGILTNAAVTELWNELKLTAKRHRLFTRAEKLCHDEAAVDSLHIQVRKLEVDPVVAEADIVMQGLEYLLGIREGNPPEEVERFYRERLGVEFTQEQRDAGRRSAQPEEVNAYFADFDNVLLQALFSMPENWGLAIEDLEELRDEE